MVIECIKLAKTQYKATIDRVAQIIHWEKCCMCSLERENKWYKHKPQSVLEKKKKPFSTINMLRIEYQILSLLRKQTENAG